MVAGAAATRRRWRWRGPRSDPSTAGVVRRRGDAGRLAGCLRTDPERKVQVQSAKATCKAQRANVLSAKRRYPGTPRRARRYVRTSGDAPGALCTLHSALCTLHFAAAGANVRTGPCSRVFWVLAADMSCRSPWENRDGKIHVRVQGWCIRRTGPVAGRARSAPAEVDDVGRGALEERRLRGRRSAAERREDPQRHPPDGDRRPLRRSQGPGHGKPHRDRGVAR